VGVLESYLLAATFDPETVDVVVVAQEGPAYFGVAYFGVAYFGVAFVQ
jgi:hypothetical protein